MIHADPLIISLMYASDSFTAFSDAALLFLARFSVDLDGSSASLKEAVTGLRSCDEPWPLVIATATGGGDGSRNTMIE